MTLLGDPDGGYRRWAAGVTPHVSVDGPAEPVQDRDELDAEGAGRLDGVPTTLFADRSAAEHSRES